MEKVFKLVILHRNNIFLKVRKVGEERYFNNKSELIRFWEIQCGIDIDIFFALPVKEAHILTRTQFDAERVSFGGFVWKINKGNFNNNKHINIVAEQKTDNLSLNEQIALCRM